MRMLLGQKMVSHYGSSPWEGGKRAISMHTQGAHYEDQEEGKDVEGCVVRALLPRATLRFGCSIVALRKLGQERLGRYGRPGEVWRCHVR